MNAKTDVCRRCGEGFPAALDPDEYEGVCPTCLAGFAAEGDVVPSTLDPLAQAAKDPPPLKRGATFRGLEVLELIGQGGMGVVYKARQIELGRIVALKILSPRLAADPEFTRRFNREAQALATLDHPNVVRVHDVGREGELCFLVMEYVDGATLRELLVQRRLPPERGLRLVPQLCEALEYAHSRGVIHRDIKPENILVSSSGVAKIADFGLAKIVSTDAMAVSSLTATNIVMGTVNYMAPEQREGRKEADHRADIYSLGVVFYELLTGELPVGRFEAPSRRSTSDARLDEVVLRALEKDPDRRYQKAGELGRDVERVSGHVPPPSADCPVVDLDGDRRLGAAPGGRFSLRTVACPVTVKGWDRPHIGVRVDGDYQFDAESKTPRLQSGVDTRNVELYLPAGADLDLTVDEGDARLADLRGSASVRIADGSLRVSAHDGPLRIQAGKGSVVVDALRSEYFEIRSRSGSVTFHDLLLARGRGQIETEGGSVVLEASAASSFRYYLETRGGTIDGPPSGQIGAGAGWLTVRTGAGSVRFTPPTPASLAWQDFLKRLTPSDIEKLGVFAIVNAGLFLFFGLVSGTVVPAVIVAVFWGMGLGLQLWKNYIRGTPGRSLTETVPSLVRKAMDLIPTPPAVVKKEPPPPPPAPPPPPPARTSKLAVLSLVLAIPAALAVTGGGITLLVMRSTAIQLTGADARMAGVAAISLGATAFAAGALGLFMAMAAGAHVAEARGALRGRGIARTASLLSIVALVVTLAWLRPQTHEMHGGNLSPNETVRLFFQHLQFHRLDEARRCLAPELGERYDSLDPMADQLRKAAPSGGLISALRTVMASDRAAVVQCQVRNSEGRWVDGPKVELTLVGRRWKIADFSDVARSLGESK
jgi:predicted Ser/Thr protein kinase